jgi:hypothetical protein
VDEKHTGTFCEYFDFIRRDYVPNTKKDSREDAARDALKKLLGD